MTTEYRNNEPGFWVGVVLICVLFFLSKCHAHAQKNATIDTIPCKVECIQKYITKSTEKSVRIYAVYNDRQSGIADIIPVSKSVYEYIVLCQDNGIKPSLGLRIRNNQIASIIRFKLYVNTVKARPTVYHK